MKKFFYNIILNARKGHRKLIKLKKLSIIRKILSDIKNEILIENQETFFKNFKGQNFKTIFNTKNIICKICICFFLFF